MNIIKPNIFKPIYFSQLKRSMSTIEQHTDVSFTNGVKKITMCHSKTRNSLSIAMMKKLIEDISFDRNNSELRIIVISSIGPIFSAGHNLKELSPQYGREQHENIFSLSSKLMNEIIDSPVPIIARVDGLAAAAGCQLVAQCDLAYCTEKSTFSTPGANFGIFCSTPGIALGRSVQKNAALHMLLTGLPISSHDAQKTGLINKVCSPETLDFEIEKVCEAIKSKSRSVIEIGKRFFYKQIQNDVKTAYKLGEKIMVDNINMADGQEGINSFIEKRKPNWSK